MTDCENIITLGPISPTFILYIVDENQWDMNSMSESQYAKNAGKKYSEGLLLPLRVGVDWMHTTLSHDAMGTSVKILNLIE